MAFELELNEFPQPTRIVDHSRNVYVFITKGSAGPEKMPFLWEMHWKNNKITFKAWENIEFDKDTGDAIVHWNVFHLNLPDELKDRQNEVRELITEALKTKGYKKKKRPVHVMFNLLSSGEGK